MRAILNKIKHDRDLELQIVWNGSTSVDLNPITNMNFIENDTTRSHKLMKRPT